MKSVILIGSIALACSFGACATKPPVVNHAPENTATAGTQDNVRFGEVVKAYPIERYRDPADPRMLHEKHVVYRVEETPAWKMQANRNQQLLIGNLVTDKRSAAKPISSQELTAEVNRARAQNTAILQSQAANTEILKNTEAALRAAAQAQEFTLRKMATMQVKLEQLEAEKKKNEEARKVQVGAGAATIQNAATTEVSSTGLLQ